MVDSAGVGKLWHNQSEVCPKNVRVMHHDFPLTRFIMVNEQINWACYDLQRGNLKLFSKSKPSTEKQQQCVMTLTRAILAGSDNAYPIRISFTVNLVDSCHMENTANCDPPSLFTTWQHSMWLFYLSRLKMLFHTKWNGIKWLPMRLSMVFYNYYNYTHS